MAKPRSRLSVTEICVNRQLDIPFVATCAPKTNGECQAPEFDQICATATVTLLEVEADSSQRAHRDVGVKVKVDVTFTLLRHGRKSVLCTDVVCFERQITIPFPPGGQICASARVALGDCAVCKDNNHKVGVVLTCPAILCLDLTIAVTKEICVPVVGPCPFPYFPKCDPKCPPCDKGSGDCSGSPGSDHDGSESDSEGDESGSGWGDSGDYDH